MANPLITRLRLLTALPEEDLRFLEQACAASTQSFEAHAHILKEGDSADHLHIVISGWACRYKLLGDGRRQLPALLLPGDACNLDGLLFARADCSVAALTPCTVAALPRGRIGEHIERSTACREVFWWLTFVENAIATEWAVCLGRRTAPERLAHLLCELLVRLAMVDMAAVNSFLLPLTQEELGDVLGVSTVHINRTLQILRSNGLIRHEGHQLFIEDWEALKRLGDFRPGYLHLEGLRAKAKAGAGRLASSLVYS